LTGLQVPFKLLLPARLTIAGSTKQELPVSDITFTNLIDAMWVAAMPADPRTPVDMNHPGAGIRA
jgi:hypothetical protein